MYYRIAAHNGRRWEWVSTAVMSRESARSIVEVLLVMHQIPEDALFILQGTTMKQLEEGLEWINATKRPGERLGGQVPVHPGDSHEAPARERGGGDHDKKYVPTLPENMKELRRWIRTAKRYWGKKLPAEDGGL